MSTDEKSLSRQWFQEARFGMFVHWGLYAITGRDMWYYSTEEVDREHYERLFHRFNPVDYNPVEWARIARRAGMRYAVFVAKHHEGFCLWDSKYTDFKATNTPCHKDLLRPWLDAYRAEGMKVGIYYSLLDWHHPDFTVDCIHPQRARAEELNKKREFSKYVRYLHDQVRELMTDYGRIDIFWPDFSYGPEGITGQGNTGLPGKGAADWDSFRLKAMIEELQPGILVNNRMGMSGEMKSDFLTPEQTIPERDIAGADTDAPMWETCEAIGASWGYARGDMALNLALKSAKLLVGHLVSCVSKNGNLLLNVGPTPRGRIQPEFVERLDEVGKWLELNGESIYGAGASGCKLHQNFCPVLNAAFTQKDKNIYLHFIDEYPPFDVIIEDIGGRISYAEFVSDKTEIEFENVIIDGKSHVKLHMPVIRPDPCDTVMRIVLE